MKNNIHPDYRHVIFHDTAANHSFLIRSTYKTEQKMKWEDGKEYPVCYLDISSESHPFYTGQQQTHKAQGRVAKFNSRFTALANKEKK